MKSVYDQMLRHKELVKDCIFKNVSDDKVFHMWNMMNVMFLVNRSLVIKLQMFEEL